MENTLRRRRFFAKSMDMSHHIMAKFVFQFSNAIKVNVFSCGMKLFDLFCRNIQAKLLFTFGQGNP